MFGSCFVHVSIFVFAGFHAGSNLPRLASARIATEVEADQGAEETKREVVDMIGPQFLAGNWEQSQVVLEKNMFYFHLYLGK